jgi:hypothetical protein
MPRCEYPKCGKEFTPNDSIRCTTRQRFCSPECRWNCWNENNPRVRKELVEKLKVKGKAKLYGKSKTAREDA